MALRGSGMLITFMDIAAADEAEFNAWYDGEHVAERVAIAGFVAARRYVAQPGSGYPKYLAYYETETLAALGAAPYLTALNNQTAWSRQTMAKFVQPGRIIAEVKTSLGQGRGGASAFIRCAPAPGRDAALAGWLEREELPRLVKQPGIVAAHLLIGDPKLSMRLDADGKPAPGQPPAPVTWIVIVEATTLEALAAVPSAHALAEAGAKPDAAIGRYSLMWELARGDMTA